MCPRQESNLDLGLRKPTFYPLNYGDRYKNKTINQSSGKNGQ